MTWFIVAIVGRSGAGARLRSGENESIQTMLSRLFAHGDRIFDVQIAGSPCPGGGGVHPCTWRVRRRVTCPVQRCRSTLRRDRTRRCSCRTGTGRRSKRAPADATRSTAAPAAGTVSSLNPKSMRIDANSGNCTRNSLAARRLRRCFSRSRFRAPSGPTVVNFMVSSHRRGDVRHPRVTTSLIDDRSRRHHRHRRGVCPGLR